MLKSIKKILIITLSITFIFSLSACDYGYYFYSDYFHKDTEVVRIELIDYNNSIVKDNP